MNTVALPTPGSLGAWMLAVRPRTLAAALAPVAVGTACAHHAGMAAALPALAALLGALLIQIGTNFVNDAADFERGTDNDGRLGPPRAAQTGVLSAASLWRAAALSFIAAAAIGAYLVWCGGWPIALLGAASIIAGVAYTAGPWPLAYIGLADAAVFIFFGGVAVCGTALVQAGTVPSTALWASIPVGALSTAMLAVNNLRDRVGDRIANKKTFAVRFGRRAAIAECVVLYAAAFSVPPIAAIVAGEIALLLPLLATPLAIGPLRAIVSGAEGVELSRALAHTARLLTVFSLLLAIAIGVM